MSYTDLPEINAFFKLEHALSCLTVYKEVAENDVIRRLRLLLGKLSRPQVAVEDNMVDYAQLLVAIMNADIDGCLPRIIAREILVTEHALNKLLAEHKAARHPMATSALSEMAAVDLEVLRTLAAVSSLTVKKLMNQKAWDQKRTELEDGISGLAVWRNQESSRLSRGELTAFSELLNNLTKVTGERGSWAKTLPELFRYHHSYGSGYLARFCSLTATDFGLQPALLGETDRKQRLLDYHGRFAELKNQTERFANGGYAADTIVTGMVGVGKHSIMRELADHFSDESLSFVYLATKDKLPINDLFQRLESHPRRAVVIIDNLQPDAASCVDQAYAQQLRQLMCRKSDNILIYLLLDVSQKALINGKLIDRKVLLSPADAGMEAFIQSFPQVCHLRLPSAEESKHLLDHLAMSFDMRLSAEQHERFSELMELNELPDTPARVLYFVKSKLMSNN